MLTWAAAPNSKIKKNPMLFLWGEDLFSSPLLLRRPVWKKYGRVDRRTESGHKDFDCYIYIIVASYL